MKEGTSLYCISGIKVDGAGRKHTRIGKGWCHWPQEISGV